MALIMVVAFFGALGIIVLLCWFAGASRYDHLPVVSTTPDRGGLAAGA